jgi:hypothetical protein
MLRTDWDGRLDPRGYHATPAKERPLKIAEWVGPTWTGDDGWTEGDRMVVLDPDFPDARLEFRVGDAVYLSNNAKGKPAEITRIDDIFANEAGDIYFMSTFYYRPERTKGVGDDWLSRELFLSTGIKQKMENSVSCIELTRVRVVEAVDERGLPDAPHNYFCRREWDVSPLLPRPNPRSCPPAPLPRMQTRHASELS